jgi:hypothetical protein
MPLTDIPFPKSSMPGEEPGEGNGRLVNTFCEVDGQYISWRAVPGLLEFKDTAKTAPPRGMFNKSEVLYVAYDGSVVTVDPATTVTTLTGTITGDDAVSWARNNASPTPDLVAVSRTNGAFSVSSSTVIAFADSDLPQPNSVATIGGYLVFTIGDGRIFATGLNVVTVGSTSFATAESNPDGLIRGTTSGGRFWAWGTNSVEVWYNAGTSPFPLARQEVIPVGLLSAFAIAGFEDGWDLQQIFVASDGTVRRMQGYQPNVVSNKDVERAIASVADKNTIRAFVHVVGGNPIFTLRAPAWCWEFNAATGFWHERESDGSDTWRAVCSAKFTGKWMVADNGSGSILEVTESAADEDGDALTMTIESGPVKSFPARIATPSAYFDWTVGVGEISGTEDETDPNVNISWSHDGGANWSTPVMRRALGGTGEFRQQLRMNRAGLTTHHGIRWRMTCSAPVHRVFRGGNMDAVPRSPA